MWNLWFINLVGFGRCSLVPQQLICHFPETITSEDLNVAVIGPIVSDIKDIVSGAIGEVNKLVGQPVEVILASADGTAQVTVQELAQIISTLLHVSFLWRHETFRSSTLTILDRLC